MSDENASKNPGGEGDNNQPNNLRPANGNYVGKVQFSFGSLAGLVGQAGIVFWILAELVGGTVLPLRLKLLLWVAVAALLFDVAHNIIDKIWDKKSVVWFGYAVFIILLLPSVFRSEPLPHFKLILNTADSPKANLMMDCNFLMFQNGHVNINGTGGFLMIPMREDGATTELRFSVSNDSPRDLEGLECTIAVPTNLECRSGPGWQQSVLMNPRVLKDSTTNELNSFGIRNIPALHPGNRETLPSLFFTPSKEWHSINMTTPVMMGFRLNNSPEVNIAFWLWFPVTTNTKAPIIAHGERLNGVKDRISITVPAGL